MLKFLEQFFWKKGASDDVGLKQGKWDKVHLCGLLSARFGLNHYLEIPTTTTGMTYAEAVKLGFQTRIRLVYRHVTEMEDGLPVEYSVPGDDTSAAIAALKRAGHRFDLIFVDPHHTYECSYRDIAEAFALLQPGGAMVIHDCRPPNADMATPDHKEGFWCGVTYKAYLDFVLANPKLNYFTFDADYGCGIILKPKSAGQRQKFAALAKRDTKLRARWEDESRDPLKVCRNFKNSEMQLLRLVDFAGLRERLHP